METSFRSGVAGVYNPSSQKVEWKDAFQAAVAGAYNPSSQQVEWKTAFRSGVACVVTGTPTLQSASSWFMIFDDD